jgi:fatty acid desaturase
VGSTVADYRTVHFQHHRALGTVGDSEFTYFFPLNLMFFVKGLFGIRVLEVLRARRTCVATGSPKKKAGSIEQNGSQLAFAGILAHLAIGGGLWFAGGVFAAVAWLVGVCSIFPLFGALRQLLEHRDDHADDTTDYARSNHGAYTRLFGSGPFSATFGGAGFNRHLLHHWEPQVSYTQLGVLEEFLLGTEMRRVMEMRRSSYGGAALKLLSLR